MRAEAEYLPDRAVCQWAIGCVFAAIKMRFIEMFTFKRDVSRPVLALEVVISFGSLVFAGAQFARLLFQAPSRAFQINPGVLIIAGVALGVAGVFGLALGLRQVVQGKPMPVFSTWLIVITAALFAAAMWVADSSAWISRDLVLLSVLPAVGASHLRYLANSRLAAA
jgi:hypothetical protein